MRILVDEKPKKGSECLFREHYNEIFKHWTCKFCSNTICSLDCGKECIYLIGKEEKLPLFKIIEDTDISFNDYK